MKIIKNILIALFLFFCAVSISWGATPIILYYDLDSGTNTGGENNKGDYVTIWGRFILTTTQALLYSETI